MGFVTICTVTKWLWDKHVSEVLIGQLLGGVSFSLAIFAYYQTSDRSLKILLTLLYVVHGTHFYLLDALVPALLCGLSLIRTVISIYSSSLTVACIFILITLVTGTLNYQSVIDILAIAASIIGIYSLFCLSGTQMRIGIICGASCWLINNLIIGSIGGTLMEVFVISTNLITIYRLQRPTN